MLLQVHSFGEMFETVNSFNRYNNMAAFIWFACLFLFADFTRGAHDIDVDRLANQQSDLVRETFSVIEDAIEAQYEMFDVRIKGLEARIEELEITISECTNAPSK